jgi:hypothetical protein
VGRHPLDEARRRLGVHAARSFALALSTLAPIEGGGFHLVDPAQTVGAVRPSALGGRHAPESKDRPPIVGAQLDVVAVAVNVVAAEPPAVSDLPHPAEAAVAGDVPAADVEADDRFDGERAAPVDRDLREVALHSMLRWSWSGFELVGVWR